MKYKLILKSINSFIWYFLRILFSKDLSILVYSFAIRYVLSVDILLKNMKTRNFKIKFYFKQN